MADQNQDKPSIPLHEVPQTPASSQAQPLLEPANPQVTVDVDACRRSLDPRKVVNPQDLREDYRRKS
jgi:hypothetical protein